MIEGSKVTGVLNSPADDNQLLRQSLAFDDGKDSPDSISISNNTVKLGEDIKFLQQFGISYSTLMQVEKRARLFQSSSADVLIMHKIMSETEYFRCVALNLGMQFEQSPMFNNVEFHSFDTPEELDQSARMISSTGPRRADGRVGSKINYIAPDGRLISGISRLKVQHPVLSGQVRITTHSANKQGLIEQKSSHYLDLAKSRLSEHYPKLSAKVTVPAAQAIVLLILIEVLLIISFFSDGLVLLSLHLVATAFYLGCISLRLLAVMRFNQLGRESEQRANRKLHYQEHKLPVYSVLVALYREAGQVEDLVVHLQNLDWPPERIEYFLICEADDLETIAAVEIVLQRRGCANFSLIRVPAAQPRTKPKALNFALPLCMGELLVVYDAEDRPHPQQLREAYDRFQTGPRNLACLQAPLAIHNHQERWLSKLFAIEYSALFDGLLPMLASYQAPLPLGGTSNHFKKLALQEIGAWDPYNVTEDADLGVRLARAGCLIGTLHNPTYEEAPVNINIWLKQRTRWFKGWYQTWLVHNRNPLAVFKDLGFGGALTFHLMIAGMAISALVHPTLAYFTVKRIYESWYFGIDSVISSPLFWLDIFTLFLGYIAFALLAHQTLAKRGLQHLSVWLWTLPVYWMLLSAAAWRAVWHLVLRPHEWEKTPHRLQRRKH